MKNPTIADVADLAGVAKSTVSAVINGKSVVAPATRRKVQATIRELNYRPRASARQRLVAHPTRALGFVVKEASNPYYTDVLRGVEEVARENGYQVYLSSSAGVFDSESQIVRSFCDMGMAGLLVTPILHAEADLSHIFELKQTNVPFVLLEKARGLQTNLVDIDNVEASCEAVKHLIQLGHSEIVHFAGPPYSEHTEERVQGVRQAFSESHLRFGPDDIVPAGASFEDGYRAALDFFGSDALGTDARPRPTGATCYNDLVALGVLRALGELGVRVPDDVSVVGFDNLDILASLGTPLTTIDVPRREMGGRAAEILIEKIEASDAHSHRKVTLDASLVVRATTAPPA